LEPTYAVAKEDLYGCFKNYCKRNNYPIITEKTFSRAIYTIYPKIEEGRLQCPGDVRKRCWVGFKYIGEEEISFRP